MRGDEQVGNARELTFSAAPAGVIPVRVPGGAAYRLVEIPGVGRAGQGDLFYNARVQMADLGADKYLLFQHPGGDFSVRLYRRPPWYWPVTRRVADALDHATVIHHAQRQPATCWTGPGSMPLR